MSQEKKAWGHVRGTMTIPGPIYTLGAGATLATSGVPATVVAMGVGANARVTRAQVDASRVIHDQFAVNEAKVNTMTLHFTRGM